LPTTVFPWQDLAEVPIARQRTVTFQMNSTDPYFAIDSKAFDPDRVDQVVTLGSTEEWVIRNESNEFHPFHIHVNDFQVMSVNGEPMPVNRNDTYSLPPNGEIVIRTQFLDFTGKFVYHCHILAHEDFGMMGVVEVVDADAATPVATPT
jgi:FtsP/CotA-like multicopper oxidase with cupredoxin domain